MKLKYTPLLLGLLFVPVSGHAEVTPTEGETVTDQAESSEPTLLFVQNAKRMEYHEGTLTLFEVDPKVLYFSDRPYRIAGEIDPEEMEALVAESFQKSAPNAALVVLTDQGIHQCVITLTKAPSFQGTTVTIPGVELVYGEPLVKAGVCSLFIDTIRVRPPLGAPPKPPRLPMPPPRPPLPPRPPR